MSLAKAVAGPAKVVAELAQKQAEVDRRWREAEFFVHPVPNPHPDTAGRKCSGGCLREGGGSR